jgi:hypothetical protein
MKKTFFFTITIFYFSLFASAQTSSKYFEYVNQAKNAFNKMEYKKAANFYSNAFQLNFSKAFVEDRYNAAIAWTLAANKDSAFSQLFKIVSLYDYTNYNQVTEDKNFLSLHVDKRWKEVTDEIARNIGKSDSKLNSSLFILLDSVYKNYYSNCLKEISIKNEYGSSSPQFYEVKKKIKQNDSVNLAIVTNTIDQYGWLGKDVVGFTGSNALAVIIQNANIQCQEKYLPLVIKAFEDKKMEAYYFASIEDKVSLRQGKKQLYGTTIVTIGNKNYVAPIEDVENIDKRRTQIGLKPIQQYLANYGIKWDINNYKKDLLLLEKEKIEY